MTLTLSFEHSLALQPVNVLYVDNPDQTEQAATAIVPTLGCGLVPKQSGTKGDTMHLYHGMQQSFTANHPSIDSAMRDLRACFREEHPRDRQAYVAAVARKEHESSLPTVRYMQPPPHELMARVVR